MKHKSIITAALLALAAWAPDAHAGDAALLKVTDIKVARRDNALALQLDIDPRAVNPGRDREVIFTPVVISAEGTDSVTLPAIRIAGRNRYFSHLRNHDLADGERLWNAGSHEPIEYRKEVPFETWMERCHIDMRQEVGHCCDPIMLDGDIPMAEIDYTVPPVTPAFNFVELTGDEAVERTAEGSAFIDFIVNRTEIRPTYRRNTVELAKIIASIDLVKNDPDATITRVTIKGFASPEGSYSNNVRLAIGRTQALKEYVREHYNFDPEIMFTDYEPEDWEGLRRRMLDLDIAHKQEILQIIDSSMEPDPKNAEIQTRYPAEYKFLLDSIYPALRHSDYTVKYRIRTYVDIDELKAVYRTNPANLRPVDFQRIAATYSSDSPEYEEVYLKAVELYPNDPEANINAANIAMKHSRLNDAQTYLRNAGDAPEAIYTRATLAAINGDLQRAVDLFDLAAQQGMDLAAQERDRVTAIIRRPTVTYLIEPTNN